VRLEFSDKKQFTSVGSPPRSYPILPITLVGLHSRSVKTFALLDTGADSTLLHSRWGLQIGLNVTSGRRVSFGGIDPKTEMWGYEHRITVVVAQKRIRCNVTFCSDIGDESTDQLIGRETIFDNLRFALRQSVGLLYTDTIP